MKKKENKRLTAKYLEKLKVPKVLIAGLLIAATLGWTGWTKLNDVKNYYQIKQIFPQKTYATEVIDGDTVVIKNGLTLRLLGIDAPGRGEENYQAAKDYLQNLVTNKELTLEYDQYQDDKFGRILAYIWVSCLGEMREIREIREYCRGDKALINEVMVKKGLAEKVVYEKRKRLKYEEYFNP